MNHRTRTIATSACAGALAVALALAGCARSGSDTGNPDSKPAETQAVPPAPGPEDGRVAVTVDGQGFHPDHIAAKAGQPITLALTRTTDETCGTEIVFKSLSIERKLPLNETVEITITPTEKGEIAFACGMDMLKGSIVVD